MGTSFFSLFSFFFSLYFSLFFSLFSFFLSFFLFCRSVPPEFLRSFLNYEKADIFMFVFCVKVRVLKTDIFRVFLENWSRLICRCDLAARSLKADKQPWSARRPFASCISLTIGLGSPWLVYSEIQLRDGQDHSGCLFFLSKTTQ